MDCESLKIPVNQTEKVTKFVALQEGGIPAPANPDLPRATVVQYRGKLRMGSSLQLLEKTFLFVTPPEHGSKRNAGLVFRSRASKSAEVGEADIGPVRWREIVPIFL